ncbi:MAG: hypothetical protein ACXWPX_08660 [Pseudobdellovibrio sp.]
MSLKGASFILSILVLMGAPMLSAQTTPNTNPPPVPPAVNPAPPNNPAPAPAPAPVQMNPAPSPTQNPPNAPNPNVPNAPAPPPNPGNSTFNPNVAPPPPAPVPEQTFIGPGGTMTKTPANGKKPPSLREIEANATKRLKSPFMIPTDLFLKIKRIEGEKQDTAIDPGIDPKRRWPLRSYSLVGVLTNVSKPKALITDPEGNVHTYRMKEFIANSGAFITAIEEGEIVIFERGVELVMKLQTTGKTNK